MAVVKCKRCGAVVSARRVGETIETSYGEDFRIKCRSLADRFGGDFTSSARECPEIDHLIRRSAFRIDV